MVTSLERAAPPTLLAALFHGLADPARLSCLLSLRERSRLVGDIVALTGLSQPNVSKHLACLRACGLVRAERHGRFVSYSLSDVGVAGVLDTAEGLLARVGPAVDACPTYGRQCGSDRTS